MEERVWAPYNAVKSLFDCIPMEKLTKPIQMTINNWNTYIYIYKTEIDTKLGLSEFVSLWTDTDRQTHYQDTLVVELG